MNRQKFIKLCDRIEKALMTKLKVNNFDRYEYTFPDESWTCYPYLGMCTIMLAMDDSMRYDFTELLCPYSYDSWWWDAPETIEVQEERANAILLFKEYCLDHKLYLNY